MRLTAEQRALVMERACQCCEYCWAQERFAPDPFSIEHIIPRSKGGADALANLAYACQGCNGRKYTSVEGLDPATGSSVPLYHPRHHQWADHFVWNEDYTLVVGMTPTGRASVEKLHLNRPGLVNLRRVLVMAEVHPPSCP